MLIAEHSQNGYETSKIETNKRKNDRKTTEPQNMHLFPRGENINKYVFRTT